METKVIKLSNKKFLLSITGSSIFIVLGILFIIVPELFITFLVKNTLFIIFFGVLSVLFFGFILITLIQKRLFDKKIGIEVNAEGITDNSSFVSIGLIKWEDIVSIEKSNVMSTHFLLINVKNPENYIKKAKGIKSKLLRGNYKSYGTPISISSNFINCNFAQLEDILLSSFEKYK